MYRNPLIYCTCWDPWGLGPRKLIRTPQPPPKASWRRSKLTPLLPVSKEHNYLQPLPATKPTVAPKLGIHPGRCKETQKSPQEVIDVSPGYQLVRSREQVSVTLGDEMFNGEKQLEPEVTDRVSSPRASIICDLEEQISELTTIIEQMNRDHQAARKLLCGEMERRCDAMKRSFDCKTRELNLAHKAELSELENSYREALKIEKSVAQGKLEEMQKEYKYLKNMFHMYQDTIHDEMEDKWSKRKAEWEEGEKSERERILLQQKNKMTKKFELESEEEKRRMTESYSATFESFVREKEELLKQHERDTMELQELRKNKEIIEEELHAQALILESLNTSLYQTQLELQKEAEDNRQE
ncbi:flagellum-associated coiled-coil domain-containing protein 1 isoform X2 [Cavia porcellus]|uniref:flagellum-associated coiled-coil domain-containing protein 1 isoform X2 n=1 Tax=Cavia porcellus TaxID=10141 RepID=UPI002FE20055